MIPDWDVLVLLLAAAGVAGWIDAVIGGGGLILIPAMLIAFPTAVPATALGTNKLAAVAGTSVAAVNYSRVVKVPRKLALMSVPIAFTCSAAGALSATAVSAEIIRPLVIVLMLAVGIFVAVRPSFGSNSGESPPLTGRQMVGGCIAFAVIGYYDGIFGPGTGMFLIIALTALLSRNFIESAALAKIANTATNLGALVVFAIGGNIWWALGLMLAVANVGGSILGSRTVLNRGTGVIRIALLTVVVVMSLKLAWDQWA
ncbi:TSUP family transporter [Williamsia sp.]|uniref:TSUP family transporter n=1 Tax=Williamsia sp. TaxID=1872085 RepID=UPI002F947A19